MELDQERVSSRHQTLHLSPYTLMSRPLPKMKNHLAGNFLGTKFIFRNMLAKVHSVSWLKGSLKDLGPWLWKFQKVYQVKIFSFSGLNPVVILEVIVRVSVGLNKIVIDNDWLYTPVRYSSSEPNGVVPCQLMALNRPIWRDTAHFGSRSDGDHVSRCQHQSYSGIKSYSTCSNWSLHPFFFQLFTWTS